MVLNWFKVSTEQNAKRWCRSRISWWMTRRAGAHHHGLCHQVMELQLGSKLEKRARTWDRKQEVWRSTQMMGSRWERGQGSRSSTPDRGHYRLLGVLLLYILSLDRQNTYGLRIPAVPRNNKIDWQWHEEQEEFAFFLRHQNNHCGKKSELCTTS